MTKNPIYDISGNLSINLHYVVKIEIVTKEEFCIWFINTPALSWDIRYKIEHYNGLKKAWVHYWKGK